MNTPTADGSCIRRRDRGAVAPLVACVLGMLAMPAGAQRIVSDTPPSLPLALPAPPVDAAADASGCLAIGYTVLADGQVRGVRVLDGAFSSDLDAATRQAYTDAALAQAAQWPATPGWGPPPARTYRVTGVGFTAAADGTLVAVDADRMRGTPLGDVCVIDDLAAWSERRAVGVEAAQAAGDDRVLAPRGDEPGVAWLPTQLAPPHYPRAMFRASATACVILGFIVRETGVPSDVRVMSTRVRGIGGREARQLFEQAAVEAAMQWRYVPAPDNPDRIPAFVQVPTRWNLDHGQTPGPCVVVDLPIG